MTTSAANLHKTATNMQETYESAKKTKDSYEGQFKAQETGFLTQIKSVFEKEMRGVEERINEKLCKIESNIDDLKMRVAKIKAKNTVLDTRVNELDRTFCAHKHPPGRFVLSGGDDDSDCIVS